MNPSLFCSKSYRYDNERVIVTVTLSLKNKKNKNKKLVIVTVTLSCLLSLRYLFGHIWEMSVSSSNNNSSRRLVRKCRRGSGDAKKAGIRVKNNVKSDLQFIRGMIGIHPASSEGDVVETLIKMFKQKR